MRDTKKTLRLLKELKNPNNWKICYTELERKTGIPKSTIHDYVVRDNDGRVLKKHREMMFGGKQNGGKEK